jgi:hypothetical protein
MDTICPDCDVVENDGFCKSCLTNENKSTSEDDDEDDDEDDE